jgi:hypothetical protein
LLLVEEKCGFKVILQETGTQCIYQPQLELLQYLELHGFRSFIVSGGGTAEWLQDGYLDVNQRACYFQIAYSTASAMVMRTLGAGSKYPFTVRDAEGEFLNGSNTYKLHLPPNPPAALFWAVTAYNITDGTMVETPQLMPSINGFNKVASNKNGSVDLWFGPSKPEEAPASNWIQTVGRRNFLVALRLYGTGVEFFDQTWKPDDVVRIR